MPMLRSLPLLMLLAPVMPARAADRIVHLQVPAPLHPGIPAMPTIAAPADDAERRINGALARLDARVQQAAADCKGGDGGPASWQRSIDVPMRGPGYISFVIRDDVFCGGAHPSEATMSIVYDLRTGAPVDWTRLLPPALTGRLALSAGIDGTRMVTLTAPRLYALYRAGYAPPDGSPEDRAACTEAMQGSADAEPPAMMAWLDSKQGGLALQYDVSHVIQACALPVVVPTATLRAEGAQPALLAAISAAQAKP